MTNEEFDEYTAIELDCRAEFDETNAVAGKGARRLLDALKSWLAERASLTGDDRLSSIKRQRVASIADYSKPWPGTNADVAWLVGEVERLTAELERVHAEAAKDYDGMREFQRKYIAADHERREMRAQLQAYSDAILGQDEP